MVVAYRSYLFSNGITVNQRVILLSSSHSAESILMDYELAFKFDLSSKNATSITFHMYKTRSER